DCAVWPGCCWGPPGLFFCSKDTPRGDAPGAGGGTWRAVWPGMPATGGAPGLAAGAGAGGGAAETAGPISALARAAYSWPMISAGSFVSTWGVWYQEWPRLAHFSERPFLPRSSVGISKLAVQFGHGIRIRLLNTPW